MIAISSTLTRDEFVPKELEFQLDPPKANSSMSIAPSTITRRNNAVDLAWEDNPFEAFNPTAGKLLENVLIRCEQDVQRFPENAQLHANYGLALLNFGQLEQAKNEFSRALSISPNQFMSLTNIARIHAISGEFTQAERVYDQLAAAYPDEMSPLVSLAYIALRTEDFPRATSILKKAISVDPTAILPRYLLAVTLLRGGEAREAVHHLRVAAKDNIRSFLVHQALGIALVMAGESKRAVNSFKTALVLAPDKQNAIRALSKVLLEHQQFEGLSELLELHLERVPDDTVARELLAESFVKGGQYTAARRQLQSVMRSTQGEAQLGRKDKSRVINNIGVCYDREGNEQFALQHFMRSLDIYSELDNVAHHNLARAMIKEERFDEAWNILEAVRNGYPENHETQELQAQVLSNQGRYDEALRLLIDEVESGLATEGSYAMATGFLADVTRSFARACEIASKGLQRYPSSQMLANNLAYSLIMGGEIKKARQVLEPIRTSGAIDATKIVLAATWGLLHLWEGDLDKGTEDYNQAEDLARDSYQPDLANVVRQKKHLELAKAYLRRLDFATSRVEISRGLAIRNGRDVYERDLVELKAHLSSNRSIGEPRTNPDS